MTDVLPRLTDPELAACAPVDPDAGLGCLRTEAGNLPLRAIDVHARLVGLSSRVVLTQRFRNVHTTPLEATYVFPLPDRGAVTALRMTADDRVVEARLDERGAARQAYDEAIEQGRRAAIAEEERPDVFTLRVGNVLPGEEVTVELTTVGVLPVEDGAALFRFPLVVAPRYIPGVPLEGDATGGGYLPDTDAVPDASRITPPVLLPGFPHPVSLTAQIEVDPAGLPMGEPRSSLHAVRAEGGRITIEPGSAPDRDIVLRLPLETTGRPAAALTLVPDAEGDEGTAQLTVLPPDLSAAARPKDVVLLLDRSGSMGGWKMVAARRAAARIVDTLTDRDRFAVLAFDNVVETPPNLPDGLLPATDRNRFRAVEFLSRLDARGGTELSQPLGRGLGLLTGAGTSTDDPARSRVLVLVTDGQVGNEDQLLRSHAAAIGAVRLHAVGIDRAVNAGFLGRLAVLGGGRCELVESEDRLDEAMAQIHRRIAEPLVTGVQLDTGVALEATTPARLPDLFPGVPYVVRGRYRGDGVGEDVGEVVVRGTAPDGSPFEARALVERRDAPAVTAAWARARLRDLEDRFAAWPVTLGPDHGTDRESLEREIVATSLRFSVLCRFTAFVAVDERVVTDGGEPRRIVQPVALPSGWELGFTEPLSAMPAMAAAYRPTFQRARATGRRSGPMPAGLEDRSDDVRRADALPSIAPAAGRPAATRTREDSTHKELLAREARRLRALAAEPGYRRREALLDLGSRLAPLAPPALAGDGRWAALLVLLMPESVATMSVEVLTGHVLTLLDELAS